MTDLITAYITTHNRSHLLERAVKSVMAQLYRPIELIIVNDGSSDNTAEYLNSLRSTAGLTVRVVHHALAEGANKSRNDALAVASGKWITGLDDDDYWTADRLETFVRSSWLLEARQCSALYSHMAVLSSGGLRVRKLPAVTDLQTLKGGNCIGNQIFTSVANLRSIGGFDESMPAWQDYDAWFRLVAALGSARNVGVASYVMDTSHDEVRISTRAVERLEFAYNRFLSKHGVHFTDPEEDILRLSLLCYPQAEFAVSDVVRAFVRSPAVGLTFAIKFAFKKAKALSAAVGY